MLKQFLGKQKQFFSRTFQQDISMKANRLHLRNQGGHSLYSQLRSVNSFSVQTFSFSTTSTTTFVTQNARRAFIEQLKSDNRLNTPIMNMEEHYFSYYNNLNSTDLMEIVKSELDSFPLPTGQFLCKIAMQSLEQCQDFKQAIELCDIAIAYLEIKHKHQVDIDLLWFKTTSVVCKSKLSLDYDLTTIEKQYKKSLPYLTESDKFQMQTFIVPTLIGIQEYAAAQPYAEDALLIASTKYKNEKSDEARKENLLAEENCFYTYYNWKLCSKAISHGLSAAHLISEIPAKTEAMHYLLTSISFCFAELSFESDSDEFLSKAMHILNEIPDCSIESNNVYPRYVKHQQLLLQAADKKNNKQNLQQQQEQAPVFKYLNETSNNSTSNLKSKLEYYENFLKDFSEVNDAQKIIALKIKIGEVYFEMEELTQAIASNLQARKLIKSLRSDEAQSQTARSLGMANLANLATLYKLSNNLAESNSTWEEYLNHSFGSKLYSSDTFPLILQQIELNLKKAETLFQVETTLSFADYFENFLSQTATSAPEINKLRKSLLIISSQLRTTKDDFQGALEKIISAYNLNESDINVLKQVTMLSAAVEDFKKIQYFGNKYLKEADRSDEDYEHISWLLRNLQ